MKNYLFIFLFFALSIAQASAIAIPDSVGKETKDGKVFILHKVEAKETLYSLSRKYSVTVKEITSENPSVSAGLKIGQIVYIPTKLTPQVNENVNEVVENETSEPENITSENAETDTQDSVTEIKVGEERTNLLSEKIKEDLTVDEKNSLLEDSLKNDSLPYKEVINEDGYSKVLERGYAVLLENSSNEERYLAYHRTAPETTIIRIKNLENGTSVFVRVVGTLEDENPKNIIKISQKAFERLGATKINLPIEITYIP